MWRPWNDHDGALLLAPSLWTWKSKRIIGGAVMDYREYGNTIYIRMDKGDEIISCILDVCKKEQILSAVYTGIGGCGEAQIQTFIPESGTFETQTIRGMLELVALTGNIISDDQQALCHHTHAVFSYKNGEQHCMAAGHIKAITVSYTAEIELRPVIGGTIKRQFDPETGTGFWSFQ